MSRLAAAEYGAEAAKMKLLEIPTIFNGEVISLMPDDPNARVSVFSPDIATKGSVGALVVEKFASVRESVSPYVVGGDNELRATGDRGVIANNQKYTESVVGKLLVPKGVRTGKLFNIGVEAVARQELMVGMLEFGSSYAPALRDTKRHTVFFLVYGILQVTRTPQYRAGLAAAFLSTNNHTGIPSPAFAIAPLGSKISEALWKSRTNRQ